MTLSETSHPCPAIAPCPPWCRTDHTRQQSIHESAIAYTGAGRALFTAYARCYRGEAATLHLYAADGLGDSSGSVEISDHAEMANLGEILELLASAGPEAIRELAAQARRAAAAATGEAS
jgi:hypothetical protein